MDAVDAEEGVSRAPSENTCFGVQLTGVRYTFPDTGVHLEVDEKSSPPSTMVPAAAAGLRCGNRSPIGLECAQAEGAYPTSQMSWHGCLSGGGACSGPNKRPWGLAGMDRQWRATRISSPEHDRAVESSSWTRWIHESPPSA